MTGTTKDGAEPVFGKCQGESGCVRAWTLSAALRLIMATQYDWRVPESHSLIHLGDRGHPDWSCQIRPIVRQVGLRAEAL